MNAVEVGMHVDIQRSDGRVHGAVVSQLKHERGCVLVEWFEKGETKGKEIDIQALLAVNPALGARETMVKTMGTVNTNITVQEDNDENEELLADFAFARRSVAPTNNAVGKTKAASQPAASRRTMLKEDVDVTTIMPNDIRDDESQDTFRDRRTGSTSARVLPPPTATRSSMPAPKTTRPPNHLVAITPVDDSILRTPDESSNESRLVTDPRMKCDTVKNIEKLQKDREERRAQQNQVKKQKELEKSIDPGNPNYQFLIMIRDYQAHLDYRPLKITDQVYDNRISVCVRKRPLSKKEINKKEIEVITIPNRDHLIVHQPQVKVDLTKYVDHQKFRFDYTFDENASNEMVYRFTAQPLVRTIFDQGFATCFAYGQTGSGKTHTMGGEFGGKNQNCSNGIYALTAKDVFRLVNADYRNLNLTVSCSFFEIYGGKVFDLLNNKALLRVLEDGKKEVNVVGLKEEDVKSDTDVIDVIRRGSEVRTAGSTSANANSSRSHAVFQINLRRGKKIWGKFSLIDLAGNERGQDTGNADRQMRTEGAEINKSLLALKECIRAMARNSHHVPFRSSKLTLVLRDSFIGEKARTCMIAMISPGMSSCDHTINTLRYADRVKELGADENGPSVPMDDEDLMLPNSEGDDELSLVCRRNGADDSTIAMMKVQSDMTDAEEVALQMQSDLNDILRSWTKESSDLVKRGSSVNLDTERHARESLAHLAKMQEALKKNTDAFTKWQRLMSQEAELSKKVAK